MDKMLLFGCVVAVLLGSLLIISMADSREGYVSASMLEIVDQQDVLNMYCAHATWGGTRVLDAFSVVEKSLDSKECVPLGFDKSAIENGRAEFSAAQKAVCGAATREAAKAAFDKFAAFNAITYMTAFTTAAQAKFTEKGAEAEALIKSKNDWSLASQLAECAFNCRFPTR